ncbi:MAG: hypothetical protein RLZZ360_416 [Candidatus Parcubacteria bacterium]|jgi:hypothetical protein
MPERFVVVDGGKSKECPETVTLNSALKKITEAIKPFSYFEGVNPDMAD